MKHLRMLNAAQSHCAGEASASSSKKDEKKDESEGGEGEKKEE